MAKSNENWHIIPTEVIERFAQSLNKPVAEVLADWTLGNLTHEELLTLNEMAEKYEKMEN